METYQEVGPLDVGGLIDKDTAAYLASLDYYVEQGAAISADQFKANLQAEADAYCKTFPDRCPGGVNQAQIDAAVAEYSASLGTQAQRVVERSYSPANTLPLAPTYYQTSPLLQSYYSPSTGYAAPTGHAAPEPVPTSPAFTNTQNEAAVSGETSLPGTASGSGPTQGGSNQQQNPLGSINQAGVAGGFSGGNKLWLILGVLAVLVILFGRGE